MDQRGAEPGNDLVLDNRKLIIGFLMLIAVCGAFFVIGFMEGKRQGVPTPVQPPFPGALRTDSGGATAVNDGKISGTTSDPSPGKSDASVKDQLEWYKNVQGSNPSAIKSKGALERPKATAVIESKGAAAVPPKTDKATPADALKNAAATQTKTDKATGTGASKAVIPPAKGLKTSYSVQVGAFTQLREADIKSDELKTKGFSCVIEEPEPPDRYYRVKVGKFDVKAEAVAMQLKLRKAGFDGYVKSN